MSPVHDISDEDDDDGPDDNCLHCYLPEIIDAWHQERPHIPGIQLAGDLVNIAGELIASYCVNRSVEEFERQLKLIEMQLYACAREMREVIEEKKAKGELPGQEKGPRAN